MHCTTQVPLTQVQASEQSALVRPGGSASTGGGGALPLAAIVGVSAAAAAVIGTVAGVALAVQVNAVQTCSRMHIAIRCTLLDKTISLNHSLIPEPQKICNLRCSAGSAARRWPSSGRARLRPCSATPSSSWRRWRRRCADPSKQH